MSSHPVNLGLRFMLELAALAAFGVWGWQRGEGWLRFLLAVGIPVLAAALWATFRIPGDPGPAPVAVPGLLRLAFELVLFAFAVWALQDVKLTSLSWILGIVVALYYLTSYDRIIWMISK